MLDHRDHPQSPTLTNDRFAASIGKHVFEDGRHATNVPGLHLIRASSLSCAALPNLYDPSLCVVAQGAKQAILGDSVLTYDPFKYLVAAVTLPASWQIVEASAARPYLSAQVEIDAATMHEFLHLHRCENGPSDGNRRPTVFVSRSDEKLLDAVLRLVELLDEPESIETLAPLAIREIHYRVTKGEVGHCLRALYAADSTCQRIVRTIEMMRADYAQPLRIPMLADLANMSTSSFHAHFKAVTSFSPLQFQKRLRLIEARRLIIVEGQTAASASFRVGYESPSHFCRDYRRLFGPRR
jgi:AraC-like DNA-binding protein